MDISHWARTDSEESDSQKKTAPKSKNLGAAAIIKLVACSEEQPHALLPDNTYGLITPMNWNELLSAYTASVPSTVPSQLRSVTT